MKLFNTRKSAEITSTPERAVTSRVQGHGKKGKSVDGNSFGALSDKDNNDNNNADMPDAQDGNHKRATQRKVTAATTTDGKKGIYHLFSPTSEKDRGSKKINNNNKFKDKKKNSRKRQIYY
jgi:hypothetical protein